MVSQEELGFNFIVSNVRIFLHYLGERSKTLYILYITCALPHSEWYRRSLQTSALNHTQICSPRSLLHRSTRKGFWKTEARFRWHLLPDVPTSYGKTGHKQNQTALKIKCKPR